MRISALALALCGTALAAPGPFAPYLNRKAPEVVRQLGEETRGGVRLSRVVFLSRTATTAEGRVPSEVFAAIARPAMPGRYPGILILHGGGGSAEVDKAVEWAGRGYVALAPDLPGIGNPKKLVNSGGAWKNTVYGRKHFLAAPDIMASDIFEGALAAAQAVYLLRAQPDVIPDRVGVTGVSWGGYATIMTAGLDGRDVRAAFAIYGSGHYNLGSAFARDLSRRPPAEAELWLKQLDARNYAPGIRARFFEAAAANDTYFWPPAVSATLNDIRSPKNQVFAPNSDHWMDIPGGCERIKDKPWHDNGWMAMQAVFFDYELKGEGKPFPSVRDARVERAPDGSQRVRFKVRSVTPIKTTDVYYSKAGGEWKPRKWLKTPALGNGGWYEAAVPAGMDSIAVVTDDRPVTVSSGILLWH